MADDKKVITLEVVHHTAWEVDASLPDQEAREQCFKLVSDYLTNEQGVFYGDYGRNAWGGWDGPVVIKSDVTKHE